MGYFNPISYFIKSFIRLFTRKFFWVILILICLVLGFIVFSTQVKAATIYESTYGYYQIWDSSLISIYNNFIRDHIGSYDSFYVRYNYYQGSIGVHIGFYNQSDIGNLYVTSQIGSVSDTHAYFSMHSQYTNTNAIKMYVFSDLTLSDSSIVYDGYLDTVNDNLASQSNNYYDFNIYTNRIIYTNNSFNNVLFNGGNKEIFIAPYISNSNDISTWSFDNLELNLGSVSYNISNYYGLDYEYNGVRYSIDLSSFYNNNNNTFYIPKNLLTNDIVIRDGSEIIFQFSYRDISNVVLYDLGTFTLDLSTEQQEQANQDSEKALQGQILNEQQKTNDKLDQTNDKLDNIDNTITDSNIDDITNDTLPSENTNDITSEGVNGIFTSIYNAFCTGQAQDIVFPIPFTNSNITLSPSYVSDMLNNNGASWVVLIIQAFWWYLISRFIIKDVMNKINKIKSGNIEQIETTNIRGDML